MKTLQTPQKVNQSEIMKELNRLLSQEIGNEREIELFYAAHAHEFSDESPTSVRARPAL